MQLRKQSRTVFALIIALQLATSFGAIALLTRMGPAIATVAEENVESLTAVERMAIALASRQTDDGRQSAFESALQRSSDNITEAEESPLIESIRADYATALAGDEAARERVLQNLTLLAEVNRTALHEADRNAQRLAEAGAWAAVILAVTAFVFIRYVANRVDRLFVGPIVEIANTLEAAGNGDIYRRSSSRSDSHEIESIVEGVNALLDKRTP